MLVAIIAVMWAAVSLSILQAVKETRSAMLVGAVAVASIVWVLTEGLSAVSAICTESITLAWTVIGLCSVTALHRHIVGGYQILRHRLSALQGRRAIVTTGVISTSAAATLVAALAYPPTNYDSLVYHMPRVHFWLQNNSVAHFPTPEPRQLFSSPLSDYFTLNLMALASGSDWVAGLTQWPGYLLSVAAVSLIAKRLGADSFGQQAAAIGSATIPMMLLQASTTQNDINGALFSLVTVIGVLTLMDAGDQRGTSRLLWVPVTAVAATLAWLTKPTAALVLLPFCVWFAIRMLATRGARRTLPEVAAILVIFILMSAPWHLRNATALNGDFLAVTAPGNEHVVSDSKGLGARIGNGLRNSMMLTGTPSEAVNRRLAGGVETLYRLLATGTPERGAALMGYGDYRIPRELWNHDLAPAPVSVALIAVAIAAILTARSAAGRSFACRYLMASMASLLALATMIGWQPWINRLLLPAVLLLVALVGPALSVRRGSSGRVLTVATLSLLGLSCALAVPVTAFNQTNPLMPTPNSFWAQDRQNLRFAAVYDLGKGMHEIVKVIEDRGAETVAIRQTTGDFPVYPLLSGLPGHEFSYVGDNLIVSQDTGDESRSEVLIDAMLDEHVRPATDTGAGLEPARMLDTWSGSGWTLVLRSTP